MGVLYCHILRLATGKQMPSHLHLKWYSVLFRPSCHVFRETALRIGVTISPLARFAQFSSCCTWTLLTASSSPPSSPPCTLVSGNASLRYLGIRSRYPHNTHSKEPRARGDASRAAERCWWSGAIHVQRSCQYGRPHAFRRLQGECIGVQR